MNIFCLEDRIDTNNAPEVETKIFDALTDDMTFDASGLKYISSAGLRVLMKVRKKLGKPIIIENVASEVYDIFETTGFTELFTVKKALREVSVDGCELIGSGAFGKVYRLTPDQIVKVFQPVMTLDAIERERQASRSAFVFGIPCAIAFDTVIFGDSYGNVYEMLNARTIAEQIRKTPETLPEYARRSADLLHVLHDIDVPKGSLPRASDLLHRNIDLARDIFTPEEIKTMYKIYNAIPEGNKFVHNDFHVKNIMESNGELLLIDLGDAGAGNPIIDIIHCMMVYVINPVGRTFADSDMGFIGLTYGEMRAFWEIFSAHYWGSSAKAERVNKVIGRYAALMRILVSVTYPSFPKEAIPMYAEAMRSEVLSHA